jgi:hypothetical protein
MGTWSTWILFRDRYRSPLRQTALEGRDTRGKEPRLQADGLDGRHGSLVPQSPRAKAACKEHNATAIEAQQVIPPVSKQERPSAQLEAMRDAIHSVLVMAKDAA